MNDIFTKLVRNANHTKLILKKYKPDILLIGGTVGLIAGTALMCKASRKIDEVLEGPKQDLDDLKMEHATDIEYSDSEFRKDKATLYFHAGIEVAKLYAPGAVIWGLSYGMIFASNRELKKRNAGLAAAYAAIDTAFKFYRNNVREELGEDADRRFRYGIKQEEVEVTEVDEKTGKEKKKKVKADVIRPGTYSQYARFFDESCYNWCPESEYNLTYLTVLEANANQLLKTRGHLFLNEVYDMLGIPRTEAGQVVGWIYDDKNPIGDNCVDFGIFNKNREPNRAFVNGTEAVILLDFNVDGNILDMI